MAADRRNEGFPLWLTCVYVLTLLGAFVGNLAAYGPAGYPTTVIIGGLLGTYAGADAIKRRRSGEGGDDG